MKKLASIAAIAAISAPTFTALITTPAGAATTPDPGTVANQTAMALARDAVAIAAVNTRAVTAHDVLTALSETSMPIQLSENLGQIHGAKRTARFAVRSDTNLVQAACIKFPTSVNATPVLVNCPIEWSPANDLSQAAPAIALTTANIAVTRAASNARAVTTADVSQATSFVNRKLYYDPYLGNRHWVHIEDNIGATSPTNVVRFAIRTDANTFSVQCVSMPVGIGGTATTTSCPGG